MCTVYIIISTEFEWKFCSVFLSIPRSEEAQEAAIVLRAPALCPSAPPPASQATRHQKALGPHGSWAPAPEIEAKQIQNDFKMNSKWIKGKRLIKAFHLHKIYNVIDVLSIKLVPCLFSSCDLLRNLPAGEGQHTYRQHGWRSAPHQSPTATKLRRVERQEPLQLGQVGEDITLRDLSNTRNIKIYQNSKLF